MTIDAHSHLLQGFCPSDDLPQSFDDLQINEAELLPALDEVGLEKVVTLAQEMNRIQGKWLGSNNLAADLQKRFQGRFYGIAAFEAVTPTDQFNEQRFEEVRELVRARSVVGLLVTPPYGHYPLNDRRAYPFYQLAAEHHVPIYVHQGAMFGPPENAPQENARLWALDQVVVDFPDLILNIEHMAWPWTEELLAIMAHGPNVWTDLGVLMRRPHMLAWHLTLARDYGFLDRILWGSDYVGTDITVYEQRAQDEIDFYQNRLNPILERSGWPILSSEEIDGLLGKNAQRLLKI